jgi:hypothetical protein
MQLIPLEYVAVLQKQQAKACWKCCKTPRKVTEIFCVYTENFQQTKMIDKRYFDLSKTKISAENQMDMAVEKYIVKEGDLECRKVSKVDSSSNAIPSETLEVTCKSLVKHMQHRIDRYLELTQNETTCKS